MTVNNVDVPHQAMPAVSKFARFLAESEELMDDINTMVDISVIIPDGDGGQLPKSNRQHVKVEEYGNDGYELVPIREDGKIVRYEPQGTSKVGMYVQDLADEFFGRQNYSCSFYEDEQCSRTTIVPSSP